MKDKIRRLILSVSLIAATTAQSVGAEQPAAKPIIGINTDVEGDNPEQFQIQKPYVDAIRKAGGIPILLPPMSAAETGEALNHVDGIMMIGGADYPPELYHEEKHSSVSLMNKTRSDFDMVLVQAVLSDASMPFLGICAGCQALNISSGGSLTQDIPSMKPESKIKHASPHGWQVGFNRHGVDLIKNSKLAKAFEESKLNVVTSHHQCVDNPGKDLVVAARSEDGLVEAVEKSGSCFVVGVQWHPERDFDGNRKLFETLVKQAALHQANKSAKLNP